MRIPWWLGVPFARRNALGLCLGIPLAVFLVILVALPIPRIEWEPLPVPDEGNGCRAPVLDTLTVPSICRPITNTPVSPLYSCSPIGFSDADWRIEVRLRGLTDGCEYAFEWVSLPFRRLDPGRVRPALGFSLDPQYAPPVCDVPADGVTRCATDAAPWKAYYLVARSVSEGGQQSGPAYAGGFEVYQTDGPNIRGRMAARGLGVVLGGAGLLLPLALWWRRLNAGVPRLPRSAVVATMTAWGGAVTALALALLPSDLGGPDLLRLDRLVWQPLYGAVAGAALGVGADDLRRRYSLASTAGRLFILGTFVVLIVGGALLMHHSTSAGSGPTLSFTYLKYKSRYYIYLLLSLTLPLLAVGQVPWRGPEWSLTGTLNPTRSVAARTLLVASLCGVATNAVALAVGSVVEVPNIGTSMSGFFKPASAWGILACLLPALGTLAVAVNLGEGRPPWVQSLVALADELLRSQAVDTTRRAAKGRELLGSMIAADPATLSRHARQLLPVAVCLPEVIGAVATSAHDVEQLAEQLSLPPSVASEKLRVVQDILAAARQAWTRETTRGLVPMVGRDGTLHAGVVHSHLGPNLAPEPEPRLEVWCNGRLHLAAHPVATSVQAVFNGVRDAWFPRDDVAVLRWAVVQVHLDYPDEPMLGSMGRGVSGQSYELAVALSLLELILAQPPVVPWAATGLIDHGSRVVTGVDHAATKAGITTDRVLLLPPQHVAEVSPHVDHVLEVSTRIDADRVRARLASGVVAGQRVAVAVESVYLAAAVLYGERLDA
ncbi:MAG: hypothetical protein AMXMBFR64_12790 [Myxococcales bacterium]